MSGRQRDIAAPPEFLTLAPAKCAEAGHDDFYPDSHDYPAYRAAKAICESCPLLEPCRTYAVTNYEWGIWGGTTDGDRREIRKKMRAMP